jgi:hypothetical protein
LADFIAQDPDHETYVFRRFRRLGVRNVLYLQGELIKIERELEALEKQAAASQGDIETYMSMRSWTALNENSRKPGRDLERAQRELSEDLECKLKKYCQYFPCGVCRYLLTDRTTDEALSLQREIAMLETPSPRVLSAMRQWLHGSSRAPNDSSSKLDDSDRHMFDVEADLVALRPPIEKDLLSRLLRDHWPFPAEVPGCHLEADELLSLTIDSVCHRMNGISFGISKIAAFRGS